MDEHQNTDTPPTQYVLIRHFVDKLDRFVLVVSTPPERPAIGSVITIEGFEYTVEAISHIDVKMGRLHLVVEPVGEDLRAALKLYLTPLYPSRAFLKPRGNQSA